MKILSDLKKKKSIWPGSAASILCILTLPLVLGLVFYLTFASLGPFLSKILSSGIDWWVQRLSTCLTILEAAPSLHALVIDGICTGVGSVLSFLPIIAVLFFCLSLLETCGYLRLTAAAMDRPLSRLGLSGASLIPLLTGFGCAVPAVMAAGRLDAGSRGTPGPGKVAPSKRALGVGAPSRKTPDRRVSGRGAAVNCRTLTIFMIPFLSCSARLPIYAMMTAALFPGKGGLVIGSLYLLGVAAALLLALICRLPARIHVRRPPSSGARMSRPAPNTNPAHTFCTACLCVPGSTTAELDTAGLRIPDLRAAMKAVWINVRDFSRKAFTVIFLGAMTVWFLENLTPSLTLTENPEESLLAAFGKAIAPFFAPLGFGDWRAASALIAGLSAKEAVVSTLAVMAGSVVGSPAMNQMLAATFTPLTAYTFMTFCLLYIPCIATLATVRKELGSMKYVALMILIQVGFAWIFSFLLYHLGLLLC